MSFASLNDVAHVSFFDDYAVFSGGKTKLVLILHTSSVQLSIAGCCSTDKSVAFRFFLGQLAGRDYSRFYVLFEGLDRLCGSFTN